MNKTPKLIIFDLDGTLIDSVPDLCAAVDATLLRLGLPPAGETRVRNWVGNGAEKLIKRALSHAGICEASSQNSALQYFLEYYDRHCAVKTNLYPGVESTLKMLTQHSITMAIVTNKPKRFIAPILKHLAIEPYFQYTVGGDDLPHKKPHPLPLIHCMQTLDYRSEETWMVGDSINDILAARAADIPVVAVSYGYNHGRPIEAEGSDEVIANFAHLLDTLSIEAK